MTDTVRSEWNKVKDSANYYANRAESKLEETKHLMQRQYETSKVGQKLNELAEETQRTIEPFWSQNKDNIMVGSAIAAGSLIVLLSTRI